MMGWFQIPSPRLFARHYSFQLRSSLLALLELLGKILLWNRGAGESLRRRWNYCRSRNYRRRRRWSTLGWCGLRFRKSLGQHLRS
jgi:hypothetical protein